ncbi:MAG: pilus assembly protein [Chloroflexi bacterium]|nr:pilus assembly protein [Chloroflexota bacterium]
MTSPSPKHQRHRTLRAQSMVEFALSLPILLLLIMGIVEFARMLHAFLAVENAARFAVRYATSGQWDDAYCEDFQSPHPQADADTEKCSSSAEQDAARLPSIRDAARAGGAGISMGPAPSNKYSPDREKIAFFYTTICSTRDGPDDDNNDGKPYGKGEIPDFTPLGPGFPPDGDLEDCQPTEDAGGPGDKVIVMVRFNHPLITPITGLLSFYGNATGAPPGFGSQVTLRAQREGIVERFRISDVAEVGQNFSTRTETFTPTSTASHTPTFTPTSTATKTFTPTNTFTATKTFTPTNTATSTNTTAPTNTASATASPSCGILTTDSTEPLYGTGITSDGGNNRIISLLTNVSPTYDAILTSVRLDWNGGWHDQVGTLAGQTLTKYQLGNNDILDLSPDLSLSTGAINVTHTFTASAAARTISKSTNAKFKLLLALNESYLHGRDFRLTINYTVGGLNCSILVQGRYGPTVTANVPAGVVNGPFTIGANAADTGEAGSINEVVFDIYNSAGIKVLSWRETGAPYCVNGDTGGVCKTLTPGLNWPASNNSGPGGGLITNDNYTIYITAKDNDPHKQVTRIIATISLNAPTLTPSPTFTRTNTPPPTNTPGPTNTPTITRTPTKTFTPSQTFTPAPPTSTSPPSNTPTKTLVPSATFTRTNTATRTNTPTATLLFTPTYTNSPTPSKTPTPTNTRTPIPPGG